MLECWRAPQRLALVLRFLCLARSLWTPHSNTHTACTLWQVLRAADCALSAGMSLAWCPACALAEELRAVLGSPPLRPSLLQRRYGLTPKHLRLLSPRSQQLRPSPPEGAGLARGLHGEVGACGLQGGPPRAIRLCDPLLSLLPSREWVHRRPEPSLSSALSWSPPCPTPFPACWAVVTGVP